MATKSQHSSEVYLRRLYKESVECVKRLDQSTRDKSSLSSIFLPETVSVRKKLSDTCEKLLFYKPLEYGRKAEEIVWRKCFYEPIQHVRKNISILNEKQRGLFSMLLSSASGYYISFFLRIQQEWNVNMDNVNDFPVVYLNWNQPTKTPDKKLEEFVVTLGHRFLIYLGDLARYQQEFEKSSDVRLAQHYYHAALRLKPYHGQPHNQLGTLFGGLGQNLDAAFCYLRCIFSVESFSGAEGNLLQLLEKNEIVYRNIFNDIVTNSDSTKRRSLEIKYFTSGYLNLCKVFYEDAKEFNSGPQLQQICQQILQSFTNVVGHLYPENTSKETFLYSIESSLIVKVFVTQIMLMKKLQEKASFKLSAAISLLLSMYTNFLTHIIALVTGHVTTSSIVVANPKSLSDNDKENLNGVVTTTNNFASKSESEMKILSKNGSDTKLANKNAISKKPILSVLRRRRRGSGDESEENESADDERNDDRSLEESEYDVNGHHLSDSSDSDDVIEIDSDDNEQTEEDGKNGNLMKPAENVGDGINTATEVLDDLDSLTKQNDVVSPDPVSNRLFSQSSHSSSCASFTTEPVDIRKFDTKETLNYLSTCSWMVIIKIMCDWLRCNSNMIVSIGDTTKNLWNRFTQLLNLLPKEEKLLEFIGSESKFSKELANSVVCALSTTDWYQKIPLVEDVYLRGVPSFAQAHAGLDYDSKQQYHCLESETIVRICCFRSFGHYLIRLNTAGLRYDRTRAEFFGQCDGKTVVEELDQDKRENVMRNMAKLRLKDEKENIEKIAWIPVYLVADTSTFCNKLFIVKQLVSACKFVLVVPKSVVDELDCLKKESGNAREAIRWLESQLQRGNKYVRSQKLEETAQIHDTLTNLLANKSNFREMVGLIDCSAFLSRTVTSGASTVVCILTNEDVESELFDSLTATINAANLVGVSFENAQRFWTRWQNYKKPAS